VQSFFTFDKVVIIISNTYKIREYTHRLFKHIYTYIYIYVCVCVCARAGVCAFSLKYIIDDGIFEGLEGD